MKDRLEKLWSIRTQHLRFYHTYSFLFNNDTDKTYFSLYKEEIDEKLVSGSLEVFEMERGNSMYAFLLEYLHWDTDFFGIPICRLRTVLYSDNDYLGLTWAVSEFLRQFKTRYKGSCFLEIPCEDILLIQALCSNGFRLVESRLHYYLRVSDYTTSERHNVRLASVKDIPNLRRVAEEMRNPYDRFHADIIFSDEIADCFLAKYAEECIRGLADITLVPNEDKMPPDAFLSANYLNELWPKFGMNISRLVLTAVSTETRKGWYRKLISEMMYQLKERGTEYCVMVPASANRASIHIFESMSCKLGKVTHILSFN